MRYSIFIVRSGHQRHITWDVVRTASPRPTNSWSSHAYGDTDLNQLPLALSVKVKWRGAAASSTVAAGSHAILIATTFGSVIYIQLTIRSGALRGQMDLVVGHADIVDHDVSGIRIMSLIPLLYVKSRPYTSPMCFH